MAVQVSIFDDKTTQTHSTIVNTNTYIYWSKCESAIEVSVAGRWVGGCDQFNCQEVAVCDGTVVG